MRDGQTVYMKSTVLPLSGVLPTSDARRLLTSITAEFRERGTAAGPVIYGNHRKAEAAIVPYELVELLDPIIEDLVVAARVRERLDADDGIRYSLDEVASRLGISLD